MVGLIDIAPAVETVDVQGASVTVHGVSAKGLAHLLGRFPEFRMLMTGQEVHAEQLMAMGGDAVAAIIAAGCGYPGDEAAETLAGKLSLDAQADLLAAILLHEGRQVWATRIVIGKPGMPSPLLAQQMDSITINPTWKVPLSIVQNEYLPVEAKEPGALARMGLRVKRVDGEVQITMPPGGNNPLGRIRFNFFNRFTVFQHDTPDQYLFAHIVRAESHGCMRVQDAAKYAEILASIVRPEEQWTAEKVKSLYGSAEHEISLESTIWIYLTYQTAFVDDAGKLQTRRDLYNLDSRTLAAIKGTRAIANPASERKSEPMMATPAPAAPTHRRKVAQRADQATYPLWFSSSGTRYAPAGVAARRR